MKYIQHLKKDKKLAAILPKVKPYALKKEKDLYFSLQRAIVGQQLSVKAAATIWQRYLELFPKGYPEPKLVIKMKPEKLRGAGLSFQKLGYLKNIAQFSLDHDMSFDYLNTLSDEEVIQYLIPIKGVGKWTIEMLLMFSLGRRNVFPADDLGIITAMKKLYGLKQEGKELKLKCISLSEQWSPYKSYACFYLWPWRDFGE